MFYTIPMRVTVAVGEPTAVKLAAIARVFGDRGDRAEFDEAAVKTVMDSVEEALAELIDPASVLLHVPGCEVVSSIIGPPEPAALGNVSDWM